MGISWGAWGDGSADGVLPAHFVRRQDDSFLLCAFSFSTISFSTIALDGSLFLCTFSCFLLRWRWESGVVEGEEVGEVAGAGVAVFLLAVFVFLLGELQAQGGELEGQSAVEGVGFFRVDETVVQGVQDVGDGDLDGLDAGEVAEDEQDTAVLAAHGPVFVKADVEEAVFLVSDGRGTAGGAGIEDVLAHGYGHGNSLKQAVSSQLSAGKFDRVKISGISEMRAESAKISGIRGLRVKSLESMG